MASLTSSTLVNLLMLMVDKLKLQLAKRNRAAYSSKSIQRSNGRASNGERRAPVYVIARLMILDERSTQGRPKYFYDSDLPQERRSATADGGAGRDSAALRTLQVIAACIGSRFAHPPAPVLSGRHAKSRLGKLLQTRCTEPSSARSLGQDAGHKSGHHDVLQQPVGVLVFLLSPATLFCASICGRSCLDLRISKVGISCGKLEAVELLPLDWIRPAELMAYSLQKLTERPDENFRSRKNRIGCRKLGGVW